MTSLLSERPLTDEERAAIADEPRPGVWIEDDPTREDSLRGDGRALTQHETDKLIVLEVYSKVPTSSGVPDAVTHSTLWSIAGPPYATVLGGIERPEREHPVQQRGGIHSDPLVRLLAYRAWGDRDRKWFDEGAHRQNAIDALIGLRRVVPSAKTWQPHDRVSGTGWPALMRVVAFGLLALSSLRPTA